MRQNENDLGNVNKARAEVQGLVLGEILQSLEVGSSGGSSKEPLKGCPEVEVREVSWKSGEDRVSKERVINCVKCC